MSRVVHRLLILAASFVLVGIAVPSAAQTDDLQVNVRDSQIGPDGSSELIANVSGPAKPAVLAPDAFTVREDGTAIDGVTVTPLLEADGARIVTVLSIDASGSMSELREEGDRAGEPFIQEVQEAALELIDTLSGLDIELGIHEFNSEPRRLVAPTTDAESLTDAVDAVDPRSMTALFDAVSFGIEELQAVEGDAVRSLIVLADGEDNTSVADREDAIAAANAAGIPVTIVAFETQVDDFDELRPIAEETGGRFLMATEAGDVADVFEEVATDVASQYVLSYDSGRVGGSDLQIEVEVATAEATATTSFVLQNPRILDEADDLVAAEPFDAGPLGTPLALYGVLGVTFVAALLLLLTVLVPRGDPAVARTLRRGLTVVSRAPAGARPTTGLSASALGRRALDVVEAVPTPAGYDERLQDRIDRAGWQLRASEFNALRIAGSTAVAAWLWALSGSALLGLLGLVLGAVGPTVALANARQRRQARFMELLPDTLQLLSGTLRAGYGVIQAIDTVVKESEPPMSTEFQRVLTEARLGLPLEDSLAAMADRVDNDDFRWVIVAMNIQRKVGGNLAELLDTVSDTLRGREQVRRQVKVLSAEGRLSAVVLIALPFVIIGYLLLANPRYLAPLFSEPLGSVMVAGSGLLMLLGVFWMRRLIRIDV